MKSHLKNRCADFGRLASAIFMLEQSAYVSSSVDFNVRCIDRYVAPDNPRDAGAEFRVTMNIGAAGPSL
jgi:hypothetical protein